MAANDFAMSRTDSRRVDVATNSSSLDVSPSLMSSEPGSSARMNWDAGLELVGPSIFMAGMDLIDEPCSFLTGDGVSNERCS